MVARSLSNPDPRNRRLLLLQCAAVHRLPRTFGRRHSHHLLWRVRQGRRHRQHDLYPRPRRRPVLSRNPRQNAAGVESLTDPLFSLTVIGDIRDGQSAQIVIERVTVSSTTNDSASDATPAEDAPKVLEVHSVGRGWQLRPFRFVEFYASAHISDEVDFTRAVSPKGTTTGRVRADFRTRSSMSRLSHKGKIYDTTAYFAKRPDSGDARAAAFGCGDSRCHRCKACGLGRRRREAFGGCRREDRRPGRRRGGRYRSRSKSFPFANRCVE